MHRIPINPVIVLFVLLTVFLTLGLIAVLCRLLIARSRGAAPFNADGRKSERRKIRINRMRRYGPGLSFKLASFTIALSILVIVMVSVPLFYMMVRSQQETMMKGLWDRCTVFLDGIANSVRVYLPMGNTMQLNMLPSQIDSIPEARYLTITGIQPGTPTYEDIVWASNDPDILLKINTPELQPGISRLSDFLSHRIESIRAGMDSAAGAQIGQLSQSINELTLEAVLLSQTPNPDLLNQLADIETVIRSMEGIINQTFQDLTRVPGSEPEYVLNYTADGNRRFVFFKPILYRQGLAVNYFIGLIRLEVSIESIIEQSKKAETLLLRTIFLIAFAALVLGVIGAFVLSSLIIRPIRKLMRHVEVIRDTDDMERLANVNISITSRDEIAVLGDTINEMTHGLIEAAATASDLSVGREIQKKFLPLDLDKNGSKISSGYRETKNAVFFGYYDGAKGISGDYFDYRELNERYYAIIKCDVAGKGIPAALLMIQVATMFLNYFRNWKPSLTGMHIEEIVYQINGFLETLGFKDRFAAFALCLFDSETGDLHFCNAGDNIIHICDTSEKILKSIILPSTPAAGALPNSMIELKGGYQVQTITLDHGDILLLYTDGIEEAKRSFRDLAYREIICTEGGEGAIHGNHMAGEWGEEMGSQRVNDIINAVLNRGTYSLFKWHNPEGERELVFDYSLCEGKVDEVIMALIAAEKIFRCRRDPLASEDDCVLVDKKTDAFLKKHFLQYSGYCSRTRKYPDNDAYMYYTYLMEDEQYDDLTILGIKRR
ncbi:MAG: SpoIIE family protein phosphatase [Treponema sp.]|nr:SpoIIE family protein phosphatase [Treponema sp.]